MAHVFGSPRMAERLRSNLQAVVARLLLQHRAALYGYIFACVRNHADARIASVEWSS